MVFKYVFDPWLIGCLDTENNFCQFDWKHKKRTRTKELEALNWEVSSLEKEAFQEAYLRGNKRSWVFR